MAPFTVFRAILQYFFLIFITRIVGRRPGKQLTPFEFVLIFFLGGLTLTGMVGVEASLTNAVAQIITVALTYIFVVWARDRWPRFARFTDGTPLIVLEGSQWRADTMRNMRITDDDVMAMARDQGLKTLDQIGTATLERNGEISIIPKDNLETKPAPGTQQPAGERNHQGDGNMPAATHSTAGTEAHATNRAGDGKSSRDNIQSQAGTPSQDGKGKLVPLADNVPKVNNEVAVGEDLAFQRKWWRFEHVVWSVFLLILIGDVAGAFGNGPLATVKRPAPDNSFDLEYERIERATTPSIILLHPHASAIQDGRFRLFISDSVIKELGNQRVSPQPITSTLGNGGITYDFPITATPATIQFALEPSRPGVHHFTMNTPGGTPLQARVVIVP